MKQGLHNHRAGRGGNSGASWISYSDMMAALLLIFVLILSFSMYQYISVLEKKQQELDQQSAAMTQMQISLDDKQTKIDEQSASIVIIMADLEARQNELDSTKTALALREDELEALTIQLNQKEADLAEQRSLFAAQSRKIDDLVGLRTAIITDLSTTLREKNIPVSVDKKTGNIIVGSSEIRFATGSSNLTEESRSFLDKFIPAYLTVLLRPEYSEYMGQIIIEGHTDITGSYLNNLELSQNRALAVAKYVLEMPNLSPEQTELLRRILTATGRSSSDPIYDSDGNIDLDASRRVEFKFSLKDAEMIDEMNSILNMAGE